MNKNIKMLVVKIFLLLSSFNMVGQDYFIDTLRLDFYGATNNSEKYIITCIYGEYEFVMEPNLNVVNHGTIKIPMMDSVEDYGTLVIEAKKRYLWFLWRKSKNILFFNEGQNRCVFYAIYCRKDLFVNYWENEVPSSVLYWCPYMASDKRVYNLIEKRAEGRYIN